MRAFEDRIHPLVIGFVFHHNRLSPKEAFKAARELGLKDTSLFPTDPFIHGSGNKAKRRLGILPIDPFDGCSCGYCGCPHEVASMRQDDWREEHKSHRGVKKSERRKYGN